MSKQELHSIPKIALIHDLCGYGNCSLKIALSVLAASGLCPLPLPTAILSSHTAYPDPQIIDTTNNWEGYLNQWESIGAHLDGSYTGFLGNVDQIDLLENFFKKNSSISHIIDPVMGDHGKAYKTYTPQMCAKMTNLVPYAYVLTPNLTEAAILTDQEYQGQDISIDTAKSWCKKLQDLGSKNIILKGIRKNHSLTNLLLNEKGYFSSIQTKYMEGNLFGTGDLFASIITSGLFNGISLDQSLEIATNFLSKSIEFSFHQPNWEVFGVHYEPLLIDLANNIHKYKKKKGSL